MTICMAMIICFFCQVIPRKDLPQIHVMFVPQSKRSSGGSGTITCDKLGQASLNPPNSITTSAIARVDVDEDAGDDNTVVSEGFVAGLSDLEKTRYAIMLA